MTPDAETCPECAFEKETGDAAPAAHACDLMGSALAEHACGVLDALLGLARGRGVSHWVRHGGKALTDE